MYAIGVRSDRREKSPRTVVGLFIAGDSLFFGYRRCAPCGWNSEVPEWLAKGSKKYEGGDECDRDRIADGIGAMIRSC